VDADLLDAGFDSTQPVRQALGAPPVEHPRGALQPEQHLSPCRIAVCLREREVALEASADVGPAQRPLETPHRLLADSTLPVAKDEG